MHAGSTLAITNPKLAKGLVYLPENPSKWNNAVDSGVYNGGGIAEGPYVAIAKVGLGKAPLLVTLLLLKMLRQNTFVKILAKQRKLTMVIKKKTMRFY